MLYRKSIDLFKCLGRKKIMVTWWLIIHHQSWRSVMGDSIWLWIKYKIISVRYTWSPKCHLRDLFKPFITTGLLCLQKYVTGIIRLQSCRIMSIVWKFPKKILKLQSKYEIRCYSLLMLSSAYYHVSGVPWLIITDLDRMIGFIATFFTITINWLTISDYLTLATFLTGLRVSSLLLWLTWFCTNRPLLQLPLSAG
jgi:hypothetical protein